MRINKIIYILLLTAIFSTSIYSQDREEMVNDIIELTNRLENKIKDYKKLNNKYNEMKYDFEKTLLKLEKYIALYENSIKLTKESYETLSENKKLLNKYKKMLNKNKKNVIMTSVGLGLNIENMKVLPNINSSIIYMRDINLILINLLIGGGISVNISSPFNNISDINNIGINIALGIKL